MAPDGHGTLHSTVPDQGMRHVADVLIVDDDPGVLALLEVLVGRFGHDVRVAENAEDALLESAQQRPDLLLLDISLPGRDGDELVELLLRGIGRPRSLVFVSALPEDRVRELAARYDARYVHKPFDAAEFEQVIAEALAEVGAGGLLASIARAMQDGDEDEGDGHGVDRPAP